MKTSLDVSALLYLIEHLYAGVDLLDKSIKSIPNYDAPFGFVHDIEVASRCLSDALSIVKMNSKNVHFSRRNS